jgi:hypothetical protein
VIVSATTEDDEYSVYFLNPTQFKVISKSYGEEPVTGVLGTPFVASGNRLTFTMTYTSQAPTAADRLVIKTGPLTGNIDPDRDVIGRLFQNDFTLDLKGGRGNI